MIGVVQCQGCLNYINKQDFPVRKDRSDRLRPYCYPCTNNIAKARYNHHKETNPFLHKATRTRARSQSLKLPFDLDEDYLKSIWTGECPVLKMPVFLHERSRLDEFAAELDRFIPSLGYVKGNVAFLSRRANRLKNNVTTKELKELLEWMEKYENQ